MSQCRLADLAPRLRTRVTKLSLTPRRAVLRWTCLFEQEANPDMAHVPRVAPCKNNAVCLMSHPRISEPLPDRVWPGGAESFQSTLPYLVIVVTVLFVGLFCASTQWYPILLTHHSTPAAAWWIMLSCALPRPYGKSQDALDQRRLHKNILALRASYRPEPKGRGSRFCPGSPYGGIRSYS